MRGGVGSNLTDGQVIEAHEAESLGVRFREGVLRDPAAVQRVASTSCIQDRPREGHRTGFGHTVTLINIVWLENLGCQQG